MRRLRWLWRGPSLAVGGVLIVAVRTYQALMRPLLPPLCRFEPGCSEYFVQSVKKHGPVIGCARGVWRICRCNPFGPAGLDPP